MKLKVEKKVYWFLFLHLTVFIYAIGSLCNKFASISMEKNGIFSWEFVVAFGAYFFFTVLYAVTWQYNLEHFDLSFLYTNKNFYMIWTQIFAVTILGETLYWNNICGLLFIFLGVWINARDA